MIEMAVIAAFAAVLMSCVALDVSVVYALTAGYLIFFFYGLKKGCSVKSLFKASLSGMKTVKNILFIFLLIGMITALWRAAGTIPVIICCSAKLVRPSAFVLLTFLLNCVVSVLTGTAFGTAATMGVICMSMAAAMGADPVFVGGAVVSGIFFGDRCSPVSTSALLVSELTGTDLYGNIRRMVRTAAIPFLMTCAVYLVLGMFSGGKGEIMDVQAVFSESFRLHWILLLPAFLVLVLAIFRVRVKTTLLVSIVTASFFCLVIQKIPAAEFFKLLVHGYRSEDPQTAAMINGGGLLSMVRVALIVGISSSYAGIFERTGLLLGMKRHILSLSRKITPFGSIMTVAAGTSMIACNQTLAIMLTDQLCRDTEPDKEKFAVHLENTVVVMAPLVPWSIAGSVPVATIGGTAMCLAFACYLYLLPAWNFAAEAVKRHSLGKS